MHSALERCWDLSQRLQGLQQGVLNDNEMQQIANELRLPYPKELESEYRAMRQAFNKIVELVKCHQLIRPPAKDRSLGAAKKESSQRLIESLTRKGIDPLLLVQRCVRHRHPTAREIDFIRCYYVWEPYAEKREAILQIIGNGLWKSKDRVLATLREGE